MSSLIKMLSPSIRFGNNRLFCQSVSRFSSSNNPDSKSQIEVKKGDSKEESKKKREDEEIDRSLESMKKVTWLDKRILVFTKVYDKIEDIPEYISSRHQYRKTMDRFNIIINLIGMVIVFNAAYLMIYLARRRNRLEGNVYFHEGAKVSYYDRKLKELKQLEEEERQK